MKPHVPHGWLTEREIDALVRGYSNEQLSENFKEEASKMPGSEWYRLLLAEMTRRGLPRSEEG